MKKRLPRARRANPTRSPPDDEDRTHLDRLLDRALADSFPASDPLSTLVPEQPRDEPGVRHRQPRRD